MRADSREARQLSALVKNIWAEHSLEELTRIIINYINSENSAVFAEIVKGEYVSSCRLKKKEICWRKHKEQLHGFLII